MLGRMLDYLFLPWYYWELVCFVFKGFDQLVAARISPH